MTCNSKCIHYPVCEQKNWDFANIDECPYYCAKPENPQGEWIRLDLAKRTVTRFEGYLDEDMITRIHIALEKANEADMRKGDIDE